MSETLETTIKAICGAVGRDRGRVIDVVRAVQQKLGCVDHDAMDAIAAELGVPRVEVEGVVSFYGLLSRERRGEVTIRLCNDIIDRMAGAEGVAQALSEELGIPFGETTPDGKISLERTPCMGMCDQAPAALVNEVVVTELNGDKAREMVRELRTHLEPGRLVRKFGGGNNAHPLVRAMVNNNIRRKGPLIFSPNNRGEAIRKALSIRPVEVIRAIKTARLRGRGGAGFPTGMKWEFTRASQDRDRYVICNADEGEPGTFKDRVILTELADRMIAGMTIAGYAIGAEHGILYLRGEYAYLREYLEDVLKNRREDGLLGRAICGREGFNFDVRIQMGAGAYICGEETALISSCEGLRGYPKTRPPFPAQKGYQQMPTAVNNVETFCCVAKILEEGPASFCEHGSKGSSGTKLLSISGDCHLPGVYEVPFGIRLSEVLRMAGADQAAAVQVGGPSGQMVGPEAYERTICYDDLSTGGAMMVFGADRSPLEVAQAFMEFFIDESCGYCTPCRVGNVLLKERLDKIIEGKGEVADIAYLRDLAETVKTTSRCGLGQTSPNPILSTLKSFPKRYEESVGESTDGLRRSFDVRAALAESQAITGRESVHFSG
ncbi:MAG TPA: NAD(P)H-dependent oxidoreductase subunit E [Phycisphaerae bacterium]|nr:NAD(P)H-dependent oxidoreductase subunit E [Phycisphaerae bacterium]